MFFPHPGPWPGPGVCSGRAPTPQMASCGDANVTSCPAGASEPEAAGAGSSAAAASSRAGKGSEGTRSGAHAETWGPRGLRHLARLHHRLCISPRKPGDRAFPPKCRSMLPRGTSSRHAGPARARAPGHPRRSLNFLHHVTPPSSPGVSFLLTS